MKDIFTTIIEKHLWCDVLCGSGSTIEHTKLLRDQLPGLVEKYNIKSFLDAPCGDHSWMSLVDFNRSMTYIGADIVDSMIENNRKTYPNKNFRVIDISKDPIPSVDLVFIRDCLIHLSHADIWRVLENLSKSDVKYVMMTSYKTPVPNRDISTGDFRPLNMRTNPFNLPEPLESLEDGFPDRVIRTMGLWTQQQINDAIKTNLS